MTHGCLVIYAKKDGRSIMLYTTHDGRDIPRVALGAVAHHMESRFGWLREFGRERATEMLKNMAFDDGADYPPCAAAWVIAAQPSLLVPMPAEFQCDLPSWSGLDAPYRLELEPRTWKLLDAEGRVLGVVDVEAEARAVVRGEL